jgi:biopolymer transport protein ExbD
MRRLVIGVLGVLLGACRAKAPLLDDRPCIGAEVEFWSAAPTAPARSHESLACAQLYRHTRCGDAWRAELRLADQTSRGGDVRTVERLPDATRIAQACADAYCGELGTKPLLCKGPPPTGNAELVEALRELDDAILTRELSDARTARTLAHRALVFRSVAVPLDLAPPPGKRLSVLTLDMAANGNVFLDGSAVTFEQLPAALSKLEGLEERRATIRADGAVPHGKVIAALDVLKRAGVRKVSFAVSPGKDEATP